MTMLKSKTLMLLLEQIQTDLHTVVYIPNPELYERILISIDKYFEKIKDSIK